jgi:hypothetical protein
VNLDGQILALEADRMEIGGDGGTWTFWWTGPALDSSFAVGNQIRFGRWPLGGSISAKYISIVRSENATAAAIGVGNYYTFLSTSPGSTAALPDRAGFPEMIYHLVSCCTHSAGPIVATSCDYSRLEARFDGTSTFIDFGRIGNVGPWTVTNLGSGWSHYGEATWDFRATLLGPATPE